MKKVEKNKPTAPAKGAASHHPYGPSKWPPLLACPRFASRPATADTEIGVKLHAVFESVLRGSCDAEPADAIEAHVVHMAHKLLRAVDPSWGIYIEEGVTLPDLDGRDSGIHGRLDLGWVDAEARALHITDLKFCRHPDRSHRAQGLGYAMGLAHRLGFVPELVVLHFAFADSGEVTQEVLSFKEASDEYAVNFRRIGEIARGEGSTEPRQCGWCPLCRHHESCSAPRAVAEYVEDTLADAPERWTECTLQPGKHSCA